jgi:hypothetical protein
MGAGNSKIPEDPVSRKKMFEENLKKINAMLDSNPNGPAVKTAVNKFYIQSQDTSSFLDTLEQKPELTIAEGLETKTRWENLKALYQAVLFAEKSLPLGSSAVQPFADFRGNALRVMRDDLQTRSLRIVRRAPLPPTPAYIPLPTPPSGVSVLQAKLDALKRKGGKRKTRSKRRNHKKSRKH